MMATQPAPTSAELLCHDCGFDLRAHPPDGKCPECGASVAEARRVAAIPRRPRWRDADPRWRRRMIAGLWMLALLPVINALLSFEWASNVIGKKPMFPVATPWPVVAAELGGRIKVTR